MHTGFTPPPAQGVADQTLPSPREGEPANARHARSIHALLCLLLLIPMMVAMGCPRRPTPPEYKYLEIFLHSPTDTPEPVVENTPFPLGGSRTRSFDYAKSEGPSLPGTLSCYMSLSASVLSVHQLELVVAQHPYKRFYLSGHKRWEWSGPASTTPSQIPLTFIAAASGSIQAEGTAFRTPDWATCVEHIHDSSVEASLEGETYRLPWSQYGEKVVRNVSGIGGHVTAHHQWGYFNGTSGTIHTSPPGTVDPAPGVSDYESYEAGYEWSYYISENVTADHIIFPLSLIPIQYSIACTCNFMTMQVQGCAISEERASAALNISASSGAWVLF